MAEVELNDQTENIIPLRRQECTPQRRYAQSPITRISKQLAREARRHRLSYEQLKRIFSNVREECGIEVPRIKNKVLELPSEADLKKWFDVIQDPIHRLVFQTLLQTGLRVNELCHLEVRHLDLINNQALVKNGKGSKDRFIAIGNRLRAALEIYLAGKNSRYVFETIRNSKFSKRRIQMLAEEYSRKSKISIHCHMMRHLYISRLAMRGMSSDQRGVLAGHAESSRNELQARYTHLSLQGIKEDAIKALDSFDL